jgi:hypothetical protein
MHGPELAKKLSQLVKMEKNVMRSMELVGKERMEVAVSHLFPFPSYFYFQLILVGLALKSELMNVATTLHLGREL